MTTLTNSKGVIHNYTNEYLESILVQLNSSNTYYTTEGVDVIFIKINSNKLLLLDFTYHINRNIFQNYTITYNATNPYNLEFVVNGASNEYTLQSVYNANGYIGTITSLSQVYLAMYDSNSLLYLDTHDLVRSSGTFGGLAASLKSITTDSNEISFVNDADNFKINIDLSNYEPNLTLDPNIVPVSDGTGNLTSSSILVAELGYLDGVTSSIQTQLDTKQPKVTNVSDTEIGYLDGVTSAIQTQLDTKQPKVTNVSDTEIGYLSGATSNIQTQINNISFDLNLTPNRAVETDANGDLISSVITNTELNYLDGVEGNIQTQLNNRLKKNILDAIQFSAGDGKMLNIINQAAGQDAYLHFRSQLTTNGFGFGTKNNRYGVFEYGVKWLFEADSTTSDFYTNLIAHGNINSTSLIANRALISDASKNIVSSAVTDTELSYLSGVTSNIQTQINNISFDLNLTPNRAVETDANGDLISSVITNTELNYLDGVSSNIQTQIASKQNIINNGTTLTCNKLIAETFAGTYGLEVICSRPNSYWEIAKFKNDQVNMGVSIAYDTADSQYYWNTGMKTGVSPDFFIQYNDTDKFLVDTNGNITLSGNIDNITKTELSYLSGVTSSVQTQLNNLQNPIANNTFNGYFLLRNGTELNALHAGQDIIMSYLIDLSNPDNDNDIKIDFDRSWVTSQLSWVTEQLNTKEPSIAVTANRALISDTSGGLIESSVTDIELLRLSGVSSNVQDQLNNKLNKNTFNAIQFNSTSGKMLDVINNEAGKDSYLLLKAQATPNGFGFGARFDNAFGIFEYNVKWIMVTNSTTCTFYTNLVVTGTFTESSDIRLKENINDLDNETCCAIFESINPKIYNRKGTQKKEIGFIAQDVETATDGLGITGLISKNKMNEDDDTEYLSLSYGKMNAILWGVVKNLKKEVADLRKEIDALKAN